MRRCEKCGVEADDEARFCRACGAALAAPDPVQQAPANQPPAPQVEPSRGLEPPPPPPVPAELQAGPAESAPAKNARFGPSFWIVSAIVAAVVLVLASAGGAVAWQSSRSKDAKARASSAISQADGDIQLAANAVEPGSPEESQYSAAKADLAAARQLYKTGWFLAVAAYDQAASRAASAQFRATKVLGTVDDMVSQADDLASQGNGSDAIDAYFAIYTRFPHTDAAGTSLDAAQKVLRDTSENGTYVGRASAIAAFLAKWPAKDKEPSDALALANETFSQAAKDFANEVRSSYDANREWSAAMSHGGRTTNFVESAFRGQYVDKSVVKSVQQIGPWAARTRQSSAMRQLFPTIVALARLGADCKTVADRPYRQQTIGNVSTHIYSPTQVQRVKRDASRMAPLIKKMQALMRKAGV